MPARSPFALPARRRTVARSAPPLLALAAAPVQERSVLTEALSAMLAILDDYLPPPAADLPAPSVGVTRVEEKTGGLGEMRETGERLGFSVDLRVVRLAARVRFQAWAAGPDAVDLAARRILDQVLADAEKLKRLGFLDLALEDSLLAEFFAGLNAWRKAVDFRALFEFQFELSDATGGLIARIPVEIREHLGADEIRGGVGVWDQDAAPPFVLAGRRFVTRLAALTHLPGAMAGAMAITRTFDGAVGPPADFPTLTAFLDATAGANPTSAHARVQFPSLSSFLDALSAPGAPLQFVDENGAARGFEPRALDLDEAIVLPDRAHRIEIALSAPSLGPSQVAYLHADGGQTQTN